MIRGIANRLGLPWGLCDRWALEAREALGKYCLSTYKTEPQRVMDKSLFRVHNSNNNNNNNNNNI